MSCGILQGERSDSEGVHLPVGKWDSRMCGVYACIGRGLVVTACGRGTLGIRLCTKEMV